jgi:hypothetical protein
MKPTRYLPLGGMFAVAVLALLPSVHFPHGSDTLLACY